MNRASPPAETVFAGCACRPPAGGRMGFIDARDATQEDAINKCSRFNAPTRRPLSAADYLAKSRGGARRMGFDYATSSGPTLVFRTADRGRISLQRPPGNSPRRRWRAGTNQADGRSPGLPRKPTARLRLRGPSHGSAASTGRADRQSILSTESTFFPGGRAAMGTSVGWLALRSSRPSRGGGTRQDFDG